MKQFSKILVVSDDLNINIPMGVGFYDLRLLKIDNQTMLPLCVMIIGGLQNVNHNVIILVDSRSFLLQHIEIVEAYELMGDLPQGRKLDLIQINKLAIENTQLLIHLNELTPNKRKKESVKGEKYVKVDR